MFYGRMKCVEFIGVAVVGSTFYPTGRACLILLPVSRTVSNTQFGAIDYMFPKITLMKKHVSTRTDTGSKGPAGRTTVDRWVI